PRQTEQRPRLQISRGGSGEWDVQVEFLFGALADPSFGFSAGTEGHGFPADLFHEDFPDAGEAEAEILGRSNGKERAGMRQGGNALVLFDDGANVVGIDFHGADGSEVNNGVAPLLDFFGEGKETDAGLEEIVNSHVTVAMVDDACAVLAAFYADGHEWTFDAVRAHLVARRLGDEEGAAVQRPYKGITRSAADYGAWAA